MNRQDVIPILKYVPAWFIGAGFKRQARETKKLTDKMVQLPFQAAKRLVVSPLPRMYENLPISFRKMGQLLPHM
jgi:hypothetical protein